MFPTEDQIKSYHERNAEALSRLLEDVTLPPWVQVELVKEGMPINNLNVEIRIARLGDTFVSYHSFAYPVRVRQLLSEISTLWTKVLDSQVTVRLSAIEEDLK